MYKNELKQWAETHLKPAQVGPDGWADIRCQAHDDGTPCAQIKIGTDRSDKAFGKIHCRACSESWWPDEYAKECGLPLPPEKPRGKSKRAERPIGKTKKTAEYIYKNVDGEVLYRVVRKMDEYGNKEFPQHKWDGLKFLTGKGNMKGVARVLYRLPELYAADPTQTVLFVEGEKDVHLAERLGYVSTTTPQGAKSTNVVKDWSALAGREVVIIPDNDLDGRKHALRIFDALTGTARSVGILELPDLPEKGDLSDWVTAGGTKDELKELIGHSVTRPHPLDREDTRPLIKVKKDDLYEQKRALSTELRKLEQPVFLTKDNMLVAVKGKECLYHPKVAELRSELDQRFKFVNSAGNSIIPPTYLVESFRACPQHFAIPTLKDFTVSPVVLPDGVVTTKPGYYRGTQTLYTGLVRCDDVPDNPNKNQLKDAVELLLKPLHDFPFVTDADKANALSLPLGIVGRGVIDGLTPANMIAATTHGTGKGLLSETLYRMSTGQNLAIETWKSDGEEFRKQVTSSLMEGSRLICYDNINDEMDSGNFAAVVTANTWKDRQLGSNRNLTLKNRTIFLATANNPTMSAEVQRRFITVELATNLENPADRQDFKIRNLSKWIKKNQASLIAALLTLWRAWFAAGKPRWKKCKLGSFEEYCEIIGGVLAVAGIDGFLGNKERVRAEVDSESSMWARFVSAWLKEYRNADVTASQLLDLCVYEIPGQRILPRDEPLLLPVIGPGNSMSQSSRLGRALTKVRGRVFGLSKIIRIDSEHQKNQYRLVPTSTPQASAAENISSKRAKGCKEALGADNDGVPTPHPFLHPSVEKGVKGCKSLPGDTAEELRLPDSDHDALSQLEF